MFELSLEGVQNLTHIPELFLLNGCCYLWFSWFIYLWELTLLTQGGAHTSKSKKAKSSTQKQKVVVGLYDKVCDIVGCLSELLEIQLLTDTTILQVLTS